MSTALHISGGPMPHTPESRLKSELYDEVEKNVVYACTDVALRNKETGEIFLGSRQAEPQIGPWFIGGRNIYDKGVTENAAFQVKNDLQIDLDKNRFEHIGTYSTSFPVAGPGREDHGRHTVESAMCVDLSPEEVEALNQNIASGNISDEYSSGAWYDPNEIARPDSDFPFIVKQFIRDLNEHDLTMNAVRTEAFHENVLRGLKGSIEKQKKDQLSRINELTKWGFTSEEAANLEQIAGANTSYAVAWARTAAEEYGQGELQALLEELTPDQNVGDYHIKRILKSNKITPPEVHADNGPLLRMILETAAKSIAYNKEHEGKIFAELKPLRPLGHPGSHPYEQ